MYCRWTIDARVSFIELFKASFFVCYLSPALFMELSRRLASKSCDKSFRAPCLSCPDTHCPRLVFESGPDLPRKRYLAATNRILKDEEQPKASRLRRLALELSVPRSSSTSLAIAGRNQSSCSGIKSCFAHAWLNWP
jgi:hypothetical protein